MTETQGRSDALARWTNIALGLAALLALIGVIVRGDIGTTLDSAALLLLGSLPTLRVVTMAAQWARGGDRRYATAAIALLLLMTIGVVVVSVWR